ncbi:MAG: radical SAM protein [Nanoarchaeota archaeon]
MVLRKIFLLPGIWRVKQLYETGFRLLIKEMKVIFCYHILKIRPPKKMPYHIGGIQLTNLCNSNCVFCSYRKINDRKCVMNLGLYKKVIDGYLEMGIKKIGFYSTIGEPLMDPDFYDKMKYAKSKGMEIFICSNGILIYKYLNQILSLEIEELIISLSDLDYEIESEVFGIGKIVARKKIEGILRLISKNNNKINIKKISLYFRPKRKPYKIMQNKLFEEITKYSYVDCSFLLGYDNWCGLIKKRDLKGIMRLLRPIRFRKYPCIHLFYPIVFPNGCVSVCCRASEIVKNDFIIGNVKKETLAEIMNNDQIKQTIQGFKYGKMPKKCTKCNNYMPCI